MNRVLRFYITSLLISACFLIQEISAETSSRETYLEEIVVTATRSEMAVFDAPQSVTVISEEELVASPFERIEDILRFSVGIQNYSHYGNQTGGVASHFSMRGVGRNRFLFMLDGVPLNDNFNNSIAWVAWGIIPKESIVRIEIVRGPTSAVYGTEGLGGVVNIITKKPDERREASLRVKAGSSDTRTVSGLYSQKSDRFGFLVSGGYDDSDGFYMIDPEGIEDYTVRRYREVKKGFGKASWSLNERTDLSFSALYYDHEMGKGREYFYDDLTMEQYRLGINYNGDQIDWAGMVYLNLAEKTAYQDAFVSASNSYTPDRNEMFPENKVWGVEYQNTARLFGLATVTTGLYYKGVSMDYDEDYLNSTRDVGAGGRQETVATFIDATAEFLDNRLLINAGIRFDRIKDYKGRSWDTSLSADDAYNSKIWKNYSPKLGITFHPDDLTTIRSTVGTGFKAPSLFDQYKLHIRGGGRSVRFANPNLDPEEIVTWDIGAERFFKENIWARVTYYQSWASDYIGTRTLRTYYVGSRLYTESIYQNISEVDIYGIEAELHYEIGYGISSFFNFNYNSSKVAKDEETPELVGKYLSGDPKQKYRAGFAYRNPDIINCSLAVKYNKDEYSDSGNVTKVPDYFTLDMSLWRKIGDHLTLRLDIENLTRKDDYIEDGRLFYGSIQIDF
ncbi:MAG: TonB-dependent receptor [Deltaproteobacteria bacterium]|nr:TonB-dependent receptor [Deltaproteobacteria bacterium]